jgi:hypothetical protein
LTQQVMRAASLRTWAIFLGLCLAEFLYFDARTSKHYTWIYPRWNDQIQYLTEVYTGYADARQEGWGHGLWRSLTMPAAQGALDRPLVLLLFRAAGPSRSAALALNMLAWLALQAAFFWGALRLLNSRALAWISLGLLLCWRSPLADSPGSATDFRLDFLAACAFGITFVAAAGTDRFRKTGASALFGLSVAATLAIRFLTGAYFVLIFAGLLLWILTLPGRGRRLRNLAVAAAVAAAVAGPFFWANLTAVWNYYYVLHFTGPVSVLRDSHLGIGPSLQYLFGELFREHLGSVFLGCAGGTLAVLAAAQLICPRTPPAAPDHPTLAGWLVPAAGFTAAPILILTLHNEKSSAVLGIIVPGVTALLIGAAAWLGRAPLSRLGIWLRRTAVALAVTAGLAHFVGCQWADPHSADFNAGARRVNEVADLIFRLSRDSGLKSPRIAVDQITDCLDGQILRVICYERHRQWVPFRMTLPTGYFTEREDVLMDRLAQSDFVLLPNDDSAGQGYPYDEEMRALRPKTQAWCRAHLRALGDFPLFGRTWTLYGKPELAPPPGAA